MADAQVLEARSNHVEFIRGQSSILLREGLTGREMVLYRITAAKGQVLTADLSSTNAGTGVNFYQPGKGTDDQALTVSARCPCSVTRRGNGDATPVVTLLPGVQRRIGLSGGRPVSSNSKGEIFAGWKGSDVIVTIGGLEVYTVPNSVLFGG